METLEKQLEVIKRGAVDIVSEQELVKKLSRSIKENKPLNIKAGFDPTAPDLHLGHTVLLRKLRQFQELGHKVFFLIGDFTGRIGDPSGRSEIRKQLTENEVIKNSQTYKRQVCKMLDLEKIEVVFNSQWFGKMTALEILRLTSHTTVAQILARADFKKRMSQKQDISLLEFMYPLLQGYDSVKLAADIELGGTDQIFNLLVGRDIQKDFGQEEQVVITMPLLEGTDGVQKMSKSYGNYIGINEDAGSMFGKLMSISDELMLKYYTLLTNEDLEQVKSMHPKQAKLALAENIVLQYHSKIAAQNARLEFERVFSSKQTPEDIAVFKLDKQKNCIVDILVDSGVISTRNEARRLVKQGGVRLDGKVIEKEDSRIEKSGVLKIGKHRFLRIE